MGEGQERNKNMEETLSNHSTKGRTKFSFTRMSPDTSYLCRFEDGGIWRVTIAAINLQPSPASD